MKITKPAWQIIKWCEENGYMADQDGNYRHEHLPSFFRQMHRYCNKPIDKAYDFYWSNEWLTDEPDEEARDYKKDFESLFALNELAVKNAKDYGLIKETFNSHVVDMIEIIGKERKSSELTHKEVMTGNWWFESNLSNLWSKVTEYDNKNNAYWLDYEGDFLTLEQLSKLPRSKCPGVIKLSNGGGP